MKIIKTKVISIIFSILFSFSSVKTYPSVDTKGYRKEFSQLTEKLQTYTLIENISDEDDHRLVGHTSHSSHSSHSSHKSHSSHSSHVSHQSGSYYHASHSSSSSHYSHYSASSTISSYPGTSSGSSCFLFSPNIIVAKTDTSEMRGIVFPFLVIGDFPELESIDNNIESLLSSNCDMISVYNLQSKLDMGNSYDQISYENDADFYVNGTVTYDDGEYVGNISVINTMTSSSKSIFKSDSSLEILQQAINLAILREISNWF